MKEVTLPDDEVVNIPTQITADWYKHRKTGFMDPRMLAPYADQPRLFMDQVKLKELEASIGSQGVREAIIITPVSMAPWAKFKEGDENLPFLIVSGHRRRKMAIAAEQEAVPVEIRIYKDEQAFDDDAEVLNDHRQDLSEIEIGWRLRRKRKGKVRTANLIRDNGRSRKWVVDRLLLTYLCPEIQVLVSPKLKPRERLAIGYAAAIGNVGLARGFEFDKEFDFAAKLVELGDTEPFLVDSSEDDKRFRLQQAFFSFCKKKGWKGIDSEKFVRTGESPRSQKVGYGTASGPQVSKTSGKAKGLRMRMVDWFLELNAMEFLSKSRSDLDRLFSNAVKCDLEEMADRLVLIADTLRDIASRKRSFSEEALKGQNRPEQKIFKDD